MEAQSGLLAANQMDNLWCATVSLSGPGGFLSLLWGRGKTKLPPKGVGKSSSGLSSSRGECAQVVLGDSPWRGSRWQTSFNGGVRESSPPTGPKGQVAHHSVPMCSYPQNATQWRRQVCLWSTRGGLGVIGSPNVRWGGSSGTGPWLCQLSMRPLCFWVWKDWQ